MFWNSFSLRLLFVPKLRRAVPRNQVRWRIPRFNLCLPSLLQPHWEEIGPLSLTSRNIHSSFCKSSNGQFISCFILYLWLILAFSNTFKLLNGESFQKAPCVIFTYPNAFFQNAFILKSQVWFDEHTWQWSVDMFINECFKLDSPFDSCYAYEFAFFFFSFNTVVRQTETGLCVYCLMLNQPTLSDLSPEFSRVLLVQTTL